MARLHLTFDNGPHPIGTPLVLGVLARHRLHASFFVLGRHLDTPEGQDLARRIRDAGHRLGAHSYAHETPLGDDPRPDAVAQELGRTHDLLAALWDGPRWFRPFGGGGRIGPHLLSPASVDWLVAHRYSCVLWNSVPEDWVNADAWPERALYDLSQRDDDEVVVLVLHDILPDAMRHLDAFLAAVADQGHTFTDALPADCLPIVSGAVQPRLAPMVRASG